MTLSLMIANVPQYRKEAEVKLNILLVCSKVDRSTYESVINAAPNTNLLGCISHIKDGFIAEVKEKYHPHIIVWVSGAKLSCEQSELELIESIRDNYDYIRVIYFTGEQEYKAVSGNLNDIGIYDVIDRNITNLEFNYLLENPITSKADEDTFNRKKAPRKVTKRKSKSKINKMMLLPILAIIVVVILVIVLVLLKNSQKTETEPTETTIEATEAPTEDVTLFPEIVTQAVTEKPTQKPTEKATEKPTEKATEKPTQRATAAPTTPPATQPPVSSVAVVENNNTGGGGNTTANNENGNNGGEQTVIINDNPAPASTITDDGSINFDQSSYNVTVGSTVDIYVSGLAAAQGCNWSLTNNAVVKFTSADTTHATLQATGIGVTTVTATAKSNGAIAQVLVTVEKE